MHTKNNLIVKITSLLLVIFLVFGNVAQVSAAFRGSGVSVDFERVISVSDGPEPADEEPPVEEPAEPGDELVPVEEPAEPIDADAPIDEVAEPEDEAPDAEISAADTGWYGDGSATEFYIGTVDELEGLDQLVTGGTTFAGKTIYLTADLDLAGTSFAPIGTSSTNFNGTFNGQNHTISNLTMNLGANGSYAGLFAHIGASGTANRAHFLNLTLSGFNVIAYNWVGGLAGRSSNALIDNVHIANSTVKSEQYAGGLIGHLTATDIKNSSANTVIVGSAGFDGNDQGHKMGGLGGYVSGGSLTAPRIFDNNTATNVNVTGLRECGGLFGLVGAYVWVTNNTVTDSYIASSMPFPFFGRGPWTGGLVGWANGNYSLYAGSEVSGNQVVSPRSDYKGDIVGGPLSNVRFWDVYNTTKNVGALTLAEAVTAADAGNNLKVISRKVTETAPTNIDKALTIVGPNVGISAIDGQRVNEYRVYGGTTITVNASPVVIDGLSFEGTRFNLLTPTNLRNNFYKPVSGDQYVIVVGSEAAGGADPLTAAYDLSGNAFINNPDKRMIIHLPTEAIDVQQTQMNTMFTALHPPIAMAVHKPGTSAPYSYIAGTPPVANNDSYNALGIIPLDVSAADGVLRNDHFADPSMMTASLVSTTPNGTLNLASDGSFTYTADAGFSGEDSFTYKAHAQGMESNIATVRIFVTQFNPPVISSDDISGPYFVSEEREFQVTFTNPTANATTYANLSFSILADNMVSADIDSIEVQNLSNPEEWIAITPVMDGDKLKISFGPNVGMALGLGESLTLTYRVVFNTSKDYPFSATLYSHEGEAQYAITGSNGFMNVYLRPAFSSEDIAGPYMITLQKEFNLLVDNPYRGVAYNSLSASILINNITGADIASVELRNPANAEEWLEVTPVQDGSGLRLNLGPMTGMSVQPGGALTLKLRITFNTAAVYPVAVSLFSHDQTEAIQIGSFTSAMTVCHPPTLDTSQFEGPHLKGKTKDVVITVNNPENGMPLNILGAELLIKNMAASDITIRVYAMGMGATLTPEVTPEGLLFTVPGSDLLAVEPGQSSFITLDVKVNKVGVFPVSGTVYTYDFGDPLPLVTFDKFMTVYDTPSLNLSGLNVQYLTGIEREFKIRIWNPANGGNFENLSLEFNLSNTVLDTDIGSFKVQRASDGAWVDVNPTQSGTSKITFTLDSTVLPALVPGQNHYVNLRVVFKTPATRNAAVYSWVVVPGTQILFGSTNRNMIAINGPTLSSTTIAGPFYLGEQSSFALNVSNPVGGATFTPWSAVIEIDDIIQTGFSNVEFRYPGETEWNALTPAFTPHAGEGKLVFTIPQTSAHPIEAGADWAIDIRGTFTERGTYPVKVTMYGLDGSETVTIAKLADGSSIIVQNSAPVANNDDYTTPEDNALTVAAPGVLSNDTDVDGDPLTAVLVTDVSVGSLTLNADGSFSYTPVADWNGTTTFTYKANDGTVDSNVATVSITVTPVNDAPVAQDITVTTAEDTAVNITLLGTDVDGDTLTYAVVAGPTNGTVTIAGNVATYTPNADYNGSDSFTYKANDGEMDSNTATVTITVTPVNDAPVAQDITVTTAEDTAVNITLLGTDVDGDTLTYAIVTGPGNGTVTIAGDVATYTPNADYNGSDSFTYKANDGTVDSNIATVSITVTAVNDAPEAEDIAVTTLEDTEVEITLLGTDVDGDMLTYAVVTGPGNGTVTIAGNVATYTPNADYNGSDSFTYKANDGELDSNIATVSITVTPVNDAPVAQDITVTTAEDTEVNITLLGTDVDGDTLTYAIVTGPGNGTVTIAGNVATYTPNADYNGSDSFTYKANDGTVDSNIATVSITVTAVNDAPEAEDIAVTTLEDTEVNITLLGTDVDGDTLTYAVVTGPGNGTVTIAGNVATYTPNADYNGSDSFTYKANDGELDSNTATVTITVTPVNDAPVAQDITVTTAEDTAVNITLLGTDVDGDALTYAIVTGPGNGTVTLVDDVATYTPDEDWNGVDTFTYKVNDGEFNSNVATVTITVTAVNDAPVAQDISATTLEGYAVDITLIATDIEGDPLTYAVVADPGNGTVTIAGNVASYTPTAGFSGTDSFTYKANDGQADSDPATVTITVYALPIITAEGLAGPFHVGAMGSFSVTMTNPAGGTSYTSMSASIVIENISLDDFTSIEVENPISGNWITLNAVEQGDNVVINIPATSAFATGPGDSWTLNFRGAFKSAGSYDASGTLYCHDSGEAVAIGSLSDTMVVLGASPVIGSADLAGPYFVGEQGSFTVTMTNPANGGAYTNLSAAIVIENISLQDFTSIEVRYPGTENWIVLTPEDDGAGNLVIAIPPTAAFAITPGSTWELDFRGTFLTAGHYDVTGTLYCHDGGEPIVIGSLSDTMDVYARPVISSDDVAGPYFVGEQREFHVTLDNTNGMTYTSLSASIFVADIDEDDYENIEVLRPGTTDDWVTLVPVVEEDGLRLVIGPTSNYPVVAGGSVTLTFRGTFRTAGNYPGTGTLFSHDGAAPVAIASYSATMNVYQRPVISSTNLAGPYHVGAMGSFSVTMDNPADGYTYTSMSASIVIENISLDDFTSIEVENPISGNWITLNAVEQGDNVVINIPATSAFATGPGDSWTLNFRGAFKSAGSYDASGTLYCHDSGEAVAIGSLSDTMVVLGASPVIGSADLAGPYFVGEQGSFTVTMTNPANGGAYTNLSAAIVIENISLQDFTSIEVRYPGTENWIVLSPEDDGAGNLVIAIPPTTAFAITPGSTWELDFRGTFLTAGHYDVTGTLYCHDGGEPIVIGSLSDTMDVYARPVISSDDVAGPYFVGEQREFHVTLDNTNGMTYTSLSASIFVDNIGQDDYESIEVLRPGTTDDWVTLVPVVEEDGLRLVIGPTSSYPVVAGGSVTLTFRGTFRTAGNYPGTGTLFSHDGTEPVAIASYNATMNVYQRPVISSDDVAGPYFVGEQRQFHVTLDNTDGVDYTSLSVSIFVDNIGQDDYESIEVLRPGTTDDWVTLVPVVEEDGLRLVIGPTSSYPVVAGGSVTLTFRGTFRTAGNYPGTGTLFSHDGTEPVAIASYNATMNVYQRPVISSDDVAGPYFVGEQREFHVTLDNTNGMTYTSLSASIFVDNIGQDDYESIEVLRPGTTDDWVTLVPVVEEDGLRLVIGPTSSYPVVAGGSVTLTFRGTFRTAGNYPGTGTLFSHDGTEPVAIASYSATMNVYQRPVISSDDVQGPYFVGEQRQFHVTLDNTDGVDYTSLSVSIFVDNIGQDDYESIEVLRPGTTDDWVTLVPVVEEDGLRLVIGPTSSYPVVAGGSVTLTFRGTFRTAGNYPGTGTLFSHDGTEPVAIASYNATMNVYQRPVISSDDVAGPYFVGEQREFHVTLDNTNGMTYTSLSASIFVDNIGQDDYESIEVLRPGTTDDWVTLVPVVEEDGLRLVIGPTSSYPVVAGGSVTLTFRATFRTAGNYPGTGTLFSHDGTEPVAIASYSATMNVYQRPVISSDDVQGPYFVGEQREFHVTLDNTDGVDYTSLSASIFVDNIGQDDYESIEVLRPGTTDDWVTLVPVVEEDGLRLVIGPTSSYPVVAGGSVTLTFRATFRTAGNYPGTGTLFSHDGTEPVAIASYSATMNVYQRPVISSDDVQGPYFVGEQREFHVTLDNTDGVDYTSLSASIFVADIDEDDYESIEVLRPGTTDDWVTLVPVVEEDGLRLVIGPTSNYPVSAGGSVTLTFRGTFRTAGNYPGTGTLFSHDGTEPVAIASYSATMNVYQRPVISSDDVQGPYFVGEQREFHVTLDNTDGVDYTSLSASIFVDNIGQDDYESIEVLRPGTTDDWVTLVPVVEEDGLRLVIGPTSNYPVVAGGSVTLTFRGTFRTAGNYPGTGTLFSHDGTEPVAIASYNATMNVYQRPVISSDDVQGPYFVGEQREFHVTLDNTDGVDYTSLSASIFVDNIGQDDYESIEVLRPGTTDDWVTLVPVVEEDGLRLVIGPTSSYPVVAGGSVTLTFRATFRTAGNYPGTGTLFSHDGTEPVAIASYSATMNVYQRPVISSDDVQGPYFVGEQREFHVTLDNTDGVDYTSLSASIFVADIDEDDYESIEVLRPGTTDDWVTLVPVVEEDGLRLVIGPTSNYPVSAGGSVTLTFRGTFRTAGNYPGTGTLFSHDGTEPVAIASYSATMNVYQRPVISSDDVQGPYFVGEQREFHVTLDNTDGVDYTSLSASIFVDNIGQDDYESIEVLRPGTTDDWVTLVPVVEEDGLRLVIGPTSNYPVVAGGSVTLTFRGTFRTAGNYPGTGTLFSHDGTEPVAIASYNATMNVYQRPVISSDDVQGPYFVGEQRQFHVTLDNTDGVDYTSMSAEIFVDNIGQADFETAEVKHPVTGQWIALTPVVEGSGLKLVVGPTSNYAVGPDDIVTLTFRVEFNTAGEYEATGILYCHDSGSAVEIGRLTDTMVVYARPVISSDDLAGPYFVGELQEFHVTLDNTDGTTYTSMSAEIFVDNIGQADFETAEVKHPVTGQWIALTPVVEGSGLKLVVGPTSNYAVGPDDIVTLTFRVEFNTAGEYEATGILYCHDSGSAVEIGRLTDTMVVYARPVISSDDLAGPYFVGELQEFHVTLDNTDGTTYTSMSAEIFVDNIGQADFETAEVKHPVTGQWIALTPVVEGSGLKLVVGPTSNYAVGPDDIVTLTFRVEFNTAGEYEATGILYCHDSGSAEEIGRLTDTMVVYARPVISSDDLAGPYFVGELQEFHVTLDNTDGTTYTSMSAEIFVDNIGQDDFETAEVKHPVTGQWIALTPVVEGSGLKLVVGPTSNYAVGPDDIVTLTFRVEFNTAGEYEATGILYCHDSGTAVEIGRLTDTMVVYARPVISSDDLAGPYFVGELQEFHVTLDNTDGTTYTSMSAEIFVDNIGQDDFETAEVKHPVTGQWIALTPVVEGTGLKLVVGPTSNYAVGPDDIVTLTFRVEFNTAGEYEATGILYCHDSGSAEEIGRLTDTMVVYARPVISSDDLAGPYFVGELQEFHVTLDNTDGTTYTSMSAEIFVDNIGQDDFETAEVKHPVTGQWIALTPVVEGTGLKLVVGPTSNYAVGPDDIVTLTFRVEFNTAGDYEATGILYCHDSGTAVEIGRLTDTMVVYARPVISSDDLAGPYFVGELQEFHVTLDNTDGTTYTSMSAEIFVDNIGQADFETAEVKHPVTGQWIALTPVVEGTGLKLVVGPTSNYAVGPDDIVTLTFRVEFNTAGDYEATGILYCHDSGTAVEIGRLTDTMVVYARPVISSDDLAGPYFVGELQEFHVTLDNTDGTTYTSMSAEIFVDNIGQDDFETAEVKHPVTGQWIALTPVVEGTGLKLVVGPTSNYAVGPDDIVTLTFRVEFNTAGDYEATGILYCHDSGTAVEIGRLTDTMVVYARPVISSDDLAGPYFVGELQEFHVTLDNTDGTTYTSMSAEIFVDNIGQADFETAEVKHPVTGQWIALTPVVEGTGLKLVVGPTSNYAVGPDDIVTLTFRVEFNTAGDYEATGILYCHDSGTAVEIGRLTDTMVVYARPVISSDDLAGPYFVGELQEFHVTLDNTDGTTYTSMSAEIFVDNIGQDDFETAEVKHPVTGQWIALTPVVEGSGLKLVVGPTSNYAVGPDDIVTLTFRVEFNTAGDYEATGILYCHDSGTAVEIGRLTDTMVVYARPVISSDDLAGPYFVGELQEFHVTLDNTDGTTYTSMSAEIFVDNIGQDDFETAEVKHPVTGQWIALTPVVEGSGLKLVVGPTSNYAVGPDDIVTLTFRVEFNTAGDYEATGILYCHDSGSAVEIGRLTDTMVVLPPPNVAPVAVDDDYTTLEDTLLSVDTPGILANDTDANGDDLIAILETNVSHGTLTLNENGSFSYMPDENWNGVDSFTYKVNDGELDSNVATVTITVSSVNDAPVAEDIDVTTPEDTAIGITLLGSDVEGDTLTYEIVSEPTNGTIILVDNVATYNPNENWYGVDTFTYKANDGELDSNVATVTITVTPVKDQVRAVDDEYEVDQGQTLTVPAPGVLANDIDPDNNEWVATLKTNVAHGVLVLNQDGGFVYTPDSDFRGTDSFVYTLVTYPATQSLWTDDATVTITVNPVYGMPTISSDDIEGPYTVGELREFNVTLTNPADGASYTSLSASIFVDNIGFDDYDTVEVKHPVYGTWVALTPVVDGSGLRLDVGPTSNYPVGPGDVITLTFRVNFNTPGTYPAEGTLYDTAGATPVEIASFNATLTVNHADTLDEQIKEAVNYEYDPVYEYTGDMTFDVTSNTYTMIYWPAEYLDGAPMRDLARYLGALHYQDISTVESLTYKGVVYTWNPGNPPLVGSNWKDANGVSLVSVIVAELLGQYPGTATVTLADSLYTADVSFVVDVYNTLDAEIASAPTYVYDPVYHYVGSFVFDDASNTYTVTYTDDNVAPGAMNDLARYLGALYRQAGSTVIKVTYKGVDYTWNPAEPLKGSNWEDADGTTLVSVVTADFLGGMIDPATGVTFTLSDGIHTETVTFIIVINDTTAPEVVSITAIGAEGFADVEAVGGVITVDQGYIVDHTVIVLDEDVTVEAGTVVSIGGQPYGSITAEGSVLTVVPFGSNGIASLPGTFELSIPDGSVKDLAGNALQDLVVTLVVNNVAPVANDDAYITEEDIELVVPAPGILANDVDWTPITVALVGDVSNGTLTLNANGSFSYLPDEDWHGEDSFTYKVSDGELESNTATVTITVTPVKDQVRAVDDEYETDEDVVLTVSAEDGVLSNDIDPDGNERRAVLKTDVQHGQLTLNSDGSFEYIPDADWFGEDSFIYELVTFPRTQSLWTDTATVTITVHPVNDAPVLDEIPDTTIPEMALYSFTATATDVDSTNLTFSLIGAPEGAAINATTGVFTWTPTEVQGPGVYTFTVKVCDDGDPVLCDEQLITLTVEEVNLPPVLAEIADATIPEMVQYSFTATATDPDLPVQTLTFSMLGAPDGASIDPATGVFTWTPTEVQGPGVYTFTVKVCDDGDPVLCDEQMITLTVEEVNLPPVLAEIADATIPEMVQYSFTATATDPDLPVQTLTFSMLGAPDGASIDPATGVFTWTPTEAQGYGVYTFTVKVCDDGDPVLCDEQMITLTVEEVNLPPVLAEIADATIPEMVQYSFTATATDPDLPAQTLTFSLIGAPEGAAINATTGVFTWTPTEVQGPGVYTFTVKVCDDGDPVLCDEQSLTITVEEVNLAPSLYPIMDSQYTIDEETELTVTFPAIDEDLPAQTLTFALIDAPVGATINPMTGVFSWTPTEAQGPGVYTFTVKVCDDGEPVLCDEQVITVTVEEVNLPPVLAEIGDKEVEAGEELTFTATATDPDLPVQTLTFSLLGAPDGASIDPATGVFTWTPTVDQAGDHTVTVCVSDGELEDCEEITITVTFINLPPVAVADAYTTDEDVELNVAAPGVLENDSDPNGDAITAILVDGVEHGTLTFNADGSFVYTPEQDYNGTDSFTYKASDGELESEVVTVTITINPVNDPPVAVDDAYTTAEDVILVVAAPGVLENDYDVDGDTLTATLRSDVSHGTLTLLSDGSFTYLPDPDFFGTDSFTYNLITYPGTTSEWTDWATVTITVTPVNDAPVLDEIPDATIPEMVLYSFTATATDVDSTNLTFSLIDAPTGAAIDATTGVFTWTPTEAQGPGVFTFTVKVCDDGTPVLCDQQAVTITVEEVNIAPELDPIDDYEVEVGNLLTFTVTATDPDIPVQTLIFYLDGAPVGASIDAATGVFTWIPVEGQIGEHTFEICVSDGELEDCQEIKVTVLQGYVNTAPVAKPDAYEVDYEGVLSVAAPGVLANDTDADGDELTALLVSTTANGTLVFNEDGSFLYIPRAGFSGIDTFKYKANDGELDSNIVTVTITVKAAPPQPVYPLFFPIIKK